MRDIFAIIYTERRSISKGFLLSFVLTFPFTFLPAIIKNGLSIATILARLDEAILYSLGFSAIVIIAAIANNYKGLADRKWYFDRPAFKELDFYGRIDGVGSVVYDLETVLIGKIDDYFFRLNLLDTDKKVPILEIVPLINIEDKEIEIDKLKSDFKFKKDLFFGMRIKLDQINLENPKRIKLLLIDLAKELKVLNFESLDVDEEKLKMDLRN